MVEDSGLMFKVKGKKEKRNYTLSIYFKVNRTRLIEKLNGIRIDPLKKEKAKGKNNTIRNLEVVRMV